MTTTTAQGNPLNTIFQRFPIRRGLLFGMLIIVALLAFELFNYSTTDFALADLLGDLRFLGVRWATILAIAFCGIDFAGIARLFTPEKGDKEPNEVWYLFGAWLLAATMNAMLTWWGVSIAILNNQTLGNAVVERQTMLRVVPVFVAVMVWLIRVLIIGTITVAGDKLFSEAEQFQRAPGREPQMNNNRINTPIRPINHNLQRNVNPITAAPYRPAPKPVQQTDNSFGRPEPTYHPVAMSGSNQSNTNVHR